MQMKLHHAIEKMHQLTKAGVAFSFSFVSYNATENTGGEIKSIAQATLAQGYRDNQSKKANILIAYYDHDKEQQRQFYLPLLTTFENHQIIP